MKKLYEINDGFEGTWDEAMYQEEYHLVRELTDEETKKMELFGCDYESQFIRY